MLLLGKGFCRLRVRVASPVIKVSVTSYELTCPGVSIAKQEYYYI
jgi:hypothetical protein